MKILNIKTNESGFTSVWLVLILSSLMLLLLVLVEASAGFACSSVCENVCVLAGKSVLSEFNSSLYEKYGVLALRVNESKLASMASYYIGSGLASENSLVTPKLENCTISTEAYPGLSTELFSDQISALGLQSGLYSLATENSLTQAISGLLEAYEEAGATGESTIGELMDYAQTMDDEADDLMDKADELGNQLDTMKQSEDYDEDAAASLSEEINDAKSEAKNARKNGDLAHQLIQSYNSAMNPDFETEDEEDSTISSEIDAGLPSTILESGETFSLILSGGITQFDTDSIASGEYILHTFSNLQEIHENTVLKGEVEYVLYGKKRDGENLSSVKRSLFTIRFPLNLKAVYSNPEKMAEYSAAAASFVPVPIPLTVFVLSSIEAASTSLNDIEVLCSGGRVPFIKGGSGGSYEDYLRVLLLLLPKDTKMLRLMDLMQMNLIEIEKVAFSFADFCYGFDLQAEFEKRLRVSLVNLPSTRKGNFTVQITYQ